MHSTRRISVPFLALFFFGPILQGQTVYTGTFDRHDVKLTARNNCVLSTTNASYKTGNVTFPITASCTGARVEGQITLDYPAQTPNALLVSINTSFQFQAPLGTSISIGGKFTSPVVNAPAHHVIRTKGVDQIDLCPVESGGSLVPRGESNFSVNRPCTQTRVRASMVNGRMEVALSYYVGADVSPAAGAATVMAEVTSVYVFTAGAPPAVPDVAIDHVELVQTVQDRDNTIPLVARKSTVARVFVRTEGDAQQPIAGVRGLLRAFRDGAELPGSPLAAVNEPIIAAKQYQRANQNDTLNFLLPKEWTAAGTAMLTVEIRLPDEAGEQERSNNYTEGRLIFADPPYLPPSMNVFYWPVCFQAPGPGAATCPSDNIANADILLKKLFPLADDAINYRRWNIPMKVWRQPLATYEDMSKLIASSRKFYDMIDQNLGGADQLAIWLPGAAAYLLGLADPVWANNGGRGRVTINSDTSATDLLDGAFTLAHETAHNFGLRHTNTPDSCGSEDNSPENKWPYVDGTIQEVGFDPLVMDVKPIDKMDVMTYCSPPSSNIWISPYTYTTLMNSQVLKPEAASPAVPGKVTVRAATSRGAAAEYLIISGSARRDGSGGKLDPAYRVSSAAIAGQLPGSPGTHCLRVSAAGVTDFCFTLEFKSRETGATLEEESFSLKIPFQEGVNRIGLMRGEQELAALSSSSTPSVSISSPQAGERWEGSRTITWVASDPDGAALTYAVLYSANGGVSWLPVEIDLPDSQLTFDTTEVQSGTEVYLRVLASNGIATASATVGPIEIVPVSRIEIAPSDLNLGPVLIGHRASQTFSLVNKGNGPLTIGSLVSSNATFELDLPTLPLTIESGSRQLVRVRFAPTAEGEQSATVTVGSDDPARGAITGTVRGQGVTNR